MRMERGWTRQGPRDGGKSGSEGWLGDATALPRDGKSQKKPCCRNAAELVCRMNSHDARLTPHSSRTVTAGGREGGGKQREEWRWVGR